MNSTELMQHECQIYVILGGRLEQPSLFVRVCLISNIIINIFTFPFTAVLNALVIIAVKTKRRLSRGTQRGYGSKPLNIALLHVF